MRIGGLESPATRLDGGSAARAALHWLALAGVALVGPLAAGELALRLIYLDGGRRTSGGPGGHDFEYAFNPDGPSDAERHPIPTGPKASGVTRLAIQGDSITWGIGVFDWTRLYPSQLLERLRRDGAFDLVVDAVPGHYVLDVRLRPDERIAVGAVHVRVVEQPGGHALADADVSADPPGVWTTHQLAFDVATTPMASDVEFRVEVAAGVALSVETIGLDVHYPYLEVLDPTAALNTFDTHVSLFDSHPNERAHEVLAEQLYARRRRR